MCCLVYEDNIIVIADIKRLIFHELNLIINEMRKKVFLIYY